MPDICQLLKRRLDLTSGSFDSFVLNVCCCPQAFAVQVYTELLAAVLTLASCIATAGIICLLTHICIPMASNIVVHPRLTYED